jgi:hypothetical protein
MSDTTIFDVVEKVDILIKQSFGFPSTSENKQWYEETAVEYNNYLNGEELLLDIIPRDPDFDISGTIRTASEIGLNNSDFVDYSVNSNNKLMCSIVDDSTGTVRRFKKLILEECPQLGSDRGASWFKLDNSNNNTLVDSFQFNYKQYIDNNGILIQPYLYSIFTQLSLTTSSPNLPFGQRGGNWFFERKSGILFFSDFINFSNGVQTNSNFQINLTNNKPVISFYKYIGRKGINSFIPTSVNTNNYNLLQIASTNIASGISDEIIETTNYQIINDLSLNLTSLKANSKYKILLNFNYLSSNYYDTLLNIALVYKLNNGSENMIGEYLLGNENTNFTYDFFSNNFYKDISSNIGDNINFYIKAKITSSTNNNNTNYTTLDNIYKPKIILSTLGNVLNIEEVNI